MSLEIHFQKAWNRYGYEIYALRRVGDDRNRCRVGFKIQVEMTFPKENEAMPETLFIPMDEIEELSKALIAGLQEANLMPKMTAVEAELGATKRHLNDMRSLIFEELKPNTLGE